MRHLIFTAKWIGAQCVEFLLDHFSEDEYTIVVCEPEADRTIEMLARRGVSYMRLNDEAIKVICDSPPGHFDWLLNLWGGYIFKEHVLSRADRTLNIHPAFLPYCRGRDPVVWAIRNNYPAGVTLHSITQGVDEGPIWYQEQVPYEFPVRGGELYERVIDRSWRSFCEQWGNLRDRNASLMTQPVIENNSTYKRADLLEDQLIDADSNESAKDVVLRLLAHDFSPGYSARVVFGGKLYDATLNLNAVEEKTDIKKFPLGTNWLYKK